MQRKVTTHSFLIQTWKQSRSSSELIDTVGPGISPGRARNNVPGLRAIPPVGSLTLPQRAFASIIHHTTANFRCQRTGHFLKKVIFAPGDSTGTEEPLRMICPGMEPSALKTRVQCPSSRMVSLATSPTRITEYS